MLGSRGSGGRGLGPSAGFSLISSRGGWLSAASLRVARRWNTSEAPGGRGVRLQTPVCSSEGLQPGPGRLAAVWAAACPAPRREGSSVLMEKRRPSRFLLGSPAVRPQGPRVCSPSRWPAASHLNSLPLGSFEVGRRAVVRVWTQAASPSPSALPCGDRGMGRPPSSVAPAGVAPVVRAALGPGVQSSLQ